MSSNEKTRHLAGSGVGVAEQVKGLLELFRYISAVGARRVMGGNRVLALSEYLILVYSHPFVEVGTGISQTFAQLGEQINDMGWRSERYNSTFDEAIAAQFFQIAGELRIVRWLYRSVQLAPRKRTTSTAEVMQDLMVPWVEE